MCRRPGKMVVTLAVLAPLTGGCALLEQSAGDAAGFGAGAAAGGLTGNPFVAVGVGIMARWAVDETTSWVERERRRAIHDAIAEAAGEAEEGERVFWAVDQVIPGGDAAGTVEVVRAFGERIPCREIVFEVTEGVGEGTFVAMICRGPEGWRWAVSAPATERWTGLQ